jgi:subtilisin family serine protease
MIEGGLAGAPPYRISGLSYCALDPCPPAGTHLRHTASIAAANRPGDVAWHLDGIAPGAPLAIVQVLGTNDKGTSVEVLRGLARVREWLDNGQLDASKAVIVLNVQYRGTGFTDPKKCAQHDPCVARMVNAIASTGAVVVAPSGNTSLEGLAFPGCLPGVVSAAAHDDHYVVPREDNGTGGPDLLDFVAPGRDVVVYSVEDGAETRACRSGTSFAAPAVGAALLRVMTDHGSSGRKALTELCRSAEWIGDRGYRRLDLRPEGSVDGGGQ